MRELLKRKAAPITYVHLIRDMCREAGYEAPPEHRAAPWGVAPGGAYQVPGYKARLADRRAGRARPVLARRHSRDDVWLREFIVELQPNVQPGPDEQENEEMPDAFDYTEDPVPQPAAAGGSMTEMMAMLQAMQLQQQTFIGEQRTFMGDMRASMDRVQHQQEWMHQALRFQFPDLPEYQPPPPRDRDDRQ